MSNLNRYFLMPTDPGDDYGDPDNYDNDDE